MEKNYLSCDYKGNNAVIVTGEQNDLIISKNVIENITQLTNDEEETISLLSYLKDRYELNCDEYSTKISDLFIENLFVSLLEIGFCPDQIEMALDNISYDDLFGSVEESYKEFDDRDDVAARVAYICYRVKCELQFISGNGDDENDASSTRTGR